MEKKSIIWVKTPRTASTALKRFLLQHGKVYLYEPEIASEIDSIYDPAKYPVICIVASDLRLFQIYNSQLWNDSYRFTVIRNPFDKFVSAWLYMYTGGQTQEESNSIPDIKYTIDEMVDNLPDIMIYEKPAFHITQTQTSMISDIHGHINYDKIIRYENFQNDMEEILEMVDLKGHEIPVVNSIYYERKYQGYEKYLTEYARKRIEEIYWMDLKLFDYEY